MPSTYLHNCTIGGPHENLGEAGGLQHRADHVHRHQDADQQHEQLAHQQRCAR